MATRQVTTCDRCGNDCDDAYRRIGATVDRKMDAAGSMDDECVYFDLCFDCTFWELTGFVNRLSRGEAQDWAARVQAIGKRRGA